MEHKGKFWVQGKGFGEIAVLEGQRKTGSFPDSRLTQGRGSARQVPSPMSPPQAQGRAQPPHGPRERESLGAAEAEAVAAGQQPSCPYRNQLSRLHFHGVREAIFSCSVWQSKDLPYVEAAVCTEKGPRDTRSGQSNGPVLWSMSPA